MDAPTEFVQALVDKNFASAERLLARTNINHEVNEGGWTPLHYVIEMGISESAEWLLKHGADPNWKDRSGWTPLHLAVDSAADVASQLYVEHGIAKLELGLVRLLLTYGADPTATSNDGKTPISIAQDYRRNEVADLLRAGDLLTRTVSSTHMDGKRVNQELAGKRALALPTSQAHNCHGVGE